MTKGYRYFIENEKGEWYRNNPKATLKMHTNSSNRDYKCSCDDCTGNGKDFNHWTINPLEAKEFQKDDLEYLNKMLSSRYFENCKMTEHEFID